MPAPTPLTACDPPQLDWSRPEAPAATDFGDIYFSVDGGLAETEAVFLKGCGLPERWAGRRNFVIGELGFGSGLNILSAWRMWDQDSGKGDHLHLVSAEKFPFSAPQLERALSAWPDLAGYAARLIALWPGRVKGMHRLHLAPDVTLTLIHDDVVPALRGLSAQVDAWFLDGFSPAKNPGMWSPEVMQELARLSAPGARVGTFTVARAVRAALTSAGFEAEKKQGYGRKRHRLEAVFPGDAAPLQTVLRPVIIGAGIAGASLARAFLRRGITPTIIDAGDGTAASGNPAAIVKPRLDLQDRPESRFFLTSYLYALQAYKAAGGVISEGVFHAAKSPEELARFEKLTAHAALPEEHMAMGTAAYDLQGMVFPKGLTIDPVKTCASFMEACAIITGRADRFEESAEGTAVLDANGAVLATGDHVYLATGAGIQKLAAAADLSLRYSRGQITGARTDITETLTYGGYAISLPEYTLLGATHDRLDGQDPYQTRPSDDLDNIEKFTTMTMQAATLLDGKSRASIRVTQASTLPIVVTRGAVTIMSALGSRGFVFAPLLAENAVARALSEPSFDFGKV